MKLHTEKEVFKETIELFLEHNAEILPAIVEKDYFVSLLLKRIAQIENVNIVFKGGTSLSKCYGLIKRFSEDIDIAIQFDEQEKIANAERRKLKNAIIEAIDIDGIFSLKNGDDIRSRRDFNRYEIEYPKIFSTTNAIIPHIIIETIVTFAPYPCDERPVDNFITTFLSTSNQNVIEHYELETFNMKIQAVERTFVDKLFAICDYHLAENYTKYSRHIYDVHKIWTSGLLDMTVVAMLIPDVVKDRQLYGNKTKSCQPMMNPQQTLSEAIVNKNYQQDYETVTRALMYETVAYHDCITSLQEIIALNLLPQHVLDYTKM